MNYYRHNIGDYLRKTVFLTMLQDGAYRRLLDEYYVQEKPLPLDREQLYLRVRASTKDERSAIDFALKQFFKETKRGFTNKRVVEEIYEVNRKAKVSKINGKRGGRPKTQRVISGLAKKTQSEPTQQKPTLDSTLYTLDSTKTIEAEEQTAAAFKVLGHDKPFGHSRFRRAWVEWYCVYRSVSPDEWLSAVMENFITDCQQNGMNIPPQFYEAKHDQEKIDKANWESRNRLVPL